MDKRVSVANWELTKVKLEHSASLAEQVLLSKETSSKFVMASLKNRALLLLVDQCAAFYFSCETFTQ